MNKIGIIGVGNMASAIIAGILDAGITAPEDIALYDVFPEKAQRFVDRGCNMLPSAFSLAEESEIIILATKPQNFPDMLEEIKGALDESKLIVSIAAGISIDYINEHVGKNLAIVRVLPNTPMLIGEGVSAITYREPATKAQYDFVSRIFSACGRVFYIVEEKFNEIICVHSSSPAYVFLMAKAMAEGASDQGIDELTAMKMIARTFIGAARMIEESGLPCDELIAMVTSKGGTTEASLRYFNQHDFVDTVKDAMLACTERAKELGGRK